ncbi:MAG: LysR family transcriptional regulator [Oscillospiraceae bacterium]|nr:LysR family transcriptional regulator [Oscillospiraceae bacterium]
MTTQQIDYILAVAEEKSFSKAAARLYVTQPSLSQSVMGIEKSLGVTIFDRSFNPIRLTAAGEIFVETARQIRSLEEGMKNRLSDLESSLSGTLTIGASSFRTGCLLAKSIARFRESFPGISVTVAEDSRERLLEQVKTSQLDVFIGTGQFDKRHFHAEELHKETLLLAVSQSHPFNEKHGDQMLTHEDVQKQTMRFVMAPPLSPKDMSELSFVVTDRGEFSKDRLMAVADEGGFTPKISMRARTLETMFSFVNEGFGAALIPDTLVRFGNYRVHPCYYLIDSNCVTESISLVSRKNGYFSNAAAQYSLTLKKLVDIGTWRVQG